MAAVLNFAVVVAVIAASVVIVRFGAEAVLGQCSPPWLSGTDPQLCLNAQVNRPTLTVSGSTSLADGAVIQVWAEDFGTGYNEHWITDTADLTVANGTFSGNFDLSNWGAGTVTVTALFEISSTQPSAVRDRYGPNGEHLNGPDVHLDLNRGAPPPRAIQVSTDVDLSAA